MPAKLVNALSLTTIRGLKEPGNYRDGGGLTLRIDEKGNRRWYQRVTVDGKQRNLGLGSYPQVTLTDAREAARANLAAVKQGLDPVREKARVKEAAAARAAIPTFAEAAAAYIDLHSPT